MFRVKEIIQATQGDLVQGAYGQRLAGISTDSRNLKPAEAFLALRGKNFDGHNFIRQALKAKAACLIVDQNIKFALPAGRAVIKVKNTLLALGALAQFQRQKIDIPLIAVTGSNGKTTAKEMIAWVLAADGLVLKNEGTQNNQIGLPQTLTRLTNKYKYAVVEIGTNHFGEVDYLTKIATPNIGLITNIGPSHLEFFKDLPGVFREKTTLLNHLAAPGIGLLNADDKLLHNLLSRKKTGQNIFSYGINKNCDFRASGIMQKNKKLAFTVNAKFDFELNSPGIYNIYNALSAIAVGRILGLDYPTLCSRLASFSFPQGRLNLVKIKGLNFINDTYNSNPLSLKGALMALAALDCRGRKILVMGDMLELGRQKELLHRQIAWGITNTCDLLITVGRLAGLTAQEARKRGWPTKQIFCCDNPLQARRLLFRKIGVNADDLILVKGSRSMKMEEVLGV